MRLTCTTDWKIEIFRSIGLL